MVSFVGADSGGDGNAEIITSLSWPAGVQAGDCALLWWTMVASATPTDPSGFDLKQAHLGDSGSIESRFYRKICDGTESGALNLDANAFNRQSAVLLVLRDTDLVEPVDTWAVRDEGSNVTSHSAPQVVTGATPGCVGVTAVAERASSGTTNWTTSWTERADSTTLANGSGGTITAVADDGLALNRGAGSVIAPPNWVSGNSFASDNVTVWTVSIAPGITDQTIEIGQAQEIDLARPITPVRTVPFGQASEVDAAQLIFPGQIVEIGQAVEHDAATRLAVPLGRANETDTAGQIKPIRLVPFGQASEVDAASAFGSLKTKAFGQATESDEARAVGPRVALAPETLLNGVPTPLGVRIYNNFTPALDVWVTNAVDDFSFRSSVPGGFASATITLHRPSIAGSPGSGYLFGADKSQFDQLARLFNRVQIVDQRSAEIVWEGRIEGPRRSSDSDTWELSCLGAAVVAGDIQRPMFYIDSSIESWIVKPQDWWQFQADETTKTIEVRWEGDLIWPGPAGSGFALFKALTWQRAQECGVHIGRYDITFASSAPAGAGGQDPTHLWNSISLDGFGTVGGDGLFHATNYTQDVRHWRRVNGTPSTFAATGGWLLDDVNLIDIDMGVGATGTFGDYTTAPDKVVGRIASPHVQVLRLDRAGEPLTDPADYPGDYVTLPQVVEDVVGRFLVSGWSLGSTAGHSSVNDPDWPFPGHVRPIDLYMDTSSDAAFTHLAYFDGATAEQILGDMMNAQPDAYWALWESRWGATDQSGDRNAFGHRFEWATWPLNWGYQATSLDGLEEQPTGENLYNYVTYVYPRDDIWSNEPGYKIAQGAFSQKPSGDLSTPGGFHEGNDLAWGRVSRATVVHREESTDLITARDETAGLLSRFRKTGNTGTVTVRRPIHYYDPGETSYSGASRMVQPWEIRPGKLIKITDVAPRGRIDDHSHGQDAPPQAHDGTVWRVIATEYSSSDNSCRLELDQPQAWEVSTQIGKAARPGGTTVALGKTVTVLNANPDFVTDLTGWTPLNATIARSTTTVPPGKTASLQITPNGSLSQCGAGATIAPVEAGRAYLASLWAYSPTGYASGVRVHINWLDSVGAFISTSSGPTVALTAGTWTYTEASLTAPAGAASGQVWAWQLGAPAASAVWYATAISVVDVQ